MILRVFFNLSNSVIVIFQHFQIPLNGSAAILSINQLQGQTKQWPWLCLAKALQTPKNGDTSHNLLVNCPRSVLGEEGFPSVLLVSLNLYVVSVSLCCIFWHCPRRVWLWQAAESCYYIPLGLPLIRLTKTISPYHRRKDSAILVALYWLLPSFMN